ncbi:MAG: D-alanyl-D-alanine carboxypeptidase [Chitinophagaceae bacterium]|nr:D-alanyl-D-alanine carboxypeptidase [Chitinophagaceae bacterium]
MMKINKSTVHMSLVMRRSSGIFSLLFVLGSCSVSKQIAKEAEFLFLQDSAIRNGHAGISLYEPSSGKYWYDHDGDKYFVPASNTKLFTLYAGLKYLGDSLPGLRYKEMPDSGYTYIFPTGDPSLLNPEFTRQPALDYLRKQERILIATPPPIDMYGRGWMWDDFLETDMIPLSAMPLYGNTVNIKWNAGGNLSFSPPYFSHETEINGPLPNGFRMEKKFGENKMIFIPGSSKRQSTPFIADWETVVGLLKDTLRKVSRIEQTITGLKPDRLIRSQPSDSLFRSMMRRSDNFYAEQVLLMAANEKLGRMNDGELRDTLLNTDLKGLQQKPIWVDGSGLSRYNLFTPQSFIYIINKMGNEFGWERLKNILPTGGQGTLKKLYLKDSGYIHAKTGTLSNHTALSGFMVTNSGKFIIFSILVNDFPGGATPVRLAIERFLGAIREKY